MAIETKVCKNCGTECATYIAFPRLPWGRHSFCHSCVSTLKYNQIVRWHHYHNPNFKPTKGANPFEND